MTRRPHLGRIDPRGVSPNDDRVVIFVHGILSDARTFKGLVDHFQTLDPHHDFTLWAFDYDYRQTLTVSGDQLAEAIGARAFGKRRVDIVGHSMGGLVARMAVLRHRLPQVARIVTLATPNHGTISGAQLNLMGQAATCALRTVRPIYARAAGIFDLTNANVVMQDALQSMFRHDPSRLAGKSYVSIPAQYYHTLRQVGDAMPSLMMGGVSLGRRIINYFTRLRIDLKPVHDGIVEERSNRLYPEPTGSLSEGTYMPTREEADDRILHVTHAEAEKCDHITVTRSADIADLIQAVLRADTLDGPDVDRWLKCHPGLVKLRPPVT